MAKIKKLNEHQHVLTVDKYEIEVLLKALPLLLCSTRYRDRGVMHELLRVLKEGVNA